MGRKIRNPTTGYIVDDEISQIIDQYTWIQNKYGYWRATISKNNRVFLHRFVISLKNIDLINKNVDHIDRNPSNCKYSNLRISDRMIVQGFNRSRFRNNTSGSIGVCFHNNAWQASIKYNGILLYLGRFTEKDAAIQAYNDKRDEILKNEYIPPISEF